MYGIIPPDISREQVEAAINQWIMGRNAERNRKILARHLFDGITLEQIAEEFQLSSRQVWNIISKTQETVFTKIAR